MEEWRRQRPPLPRFLLRPLEAAARGVAALPPLFAAAATPPDARRLGFEGGGIGGDFPALGAELLLEAPLLEQLIFRLNALGWWRRPHFEESWMAYLGALNASVAHPLAPEEVAHAQRLAVRGLTALLVRSLRLDAAFLHVPRTQAPRYTPLTAIPASQIMCKSMNMIPFSNLNCLSYNHQAYANISFLTIGCQIFKFLSILEPIRTL